MAFQAISTLNTTTPAEIDAQFTVGAGENCCAIYIGPSDITESHFFLYVRINAGDVHKVWTTRYSRTIFHGLIEGDTVAIGSDKVRAIQATGGTTPNMSSPNWGTSIANADRAEPRVWSPSAPHVVMGSINKLTLVAGSGWRDIFVREYDGSAWGPCVWYRTHPTYTGDVVIPVFGESVAICTQDGSAVAVKASSEATVGGTSAAYQLDMPTISSTVTVDANDGADFLTKLQAATAGTNVVLPAGTYTVASQITVADWAQGVTVSGGTGNPDDVVIQLANTSDALWLTQTDWTLLRALRHVTVSITSSFGNAAFDRVGMRCDSVKFAGDGTRSANLVNCRLSGTSDRKFHNCEFNNSGLDGINTDQGDPVWLIDCRGDRSGSVISDQVVTAHGSNHIYVLGGHYQDAHSNVMAEASGGRHYCEFMSYAKGLRQSGMRGTNLFGCRTESHAGSLSVNSEFIMCCRFKGDNQNMLRDYKGELWSNVFEQVNSTRTIFHNAAGDVAYHFQQFIDCAPSSEAIVYHSGGSSHTQRHRNYGFLRCSRMSVNSSSPAGTMDFQNVAAEGTTAYEFGFGGGSIPARTTSDYGVYTQAGTTHQANGAGPNDMFNQAGFMQNTCLPVVSGLTHDSGDASLYDWIGGRGFTAMPLSYESGIVSRGALQRPTDSGTIFPDAWNALAVAQSDEDDEPEPPPSPDPTGNNYSIQAMLETRSGDLKVLWKANLVSLTGSQVASPTYQIVSNNTVLASGSLTWTGSEFRAETLSATLPVRQNYTLRCTASIGGNSVTREQLITPRY
jgi:hypothetical protein